MSRSTAFLILFGATRTGNKTESRSESETTFPTEMASMDSYNKAIATEDSYSNVEVSDANLPTEVASAQFFFGLLRLPASGPLRRY